jgi:hypothetical protein
MDELFEYFCNDHPYLEDMVNGLQKEELDEYEVVIMTVGIHVDRILKEFANTDEHYARLGADESERLGKKAANLSYGEVFKLSQKLLDHKLVAIIVELKKD